jgi:ethanolamine ammonia-lyase large subunit
VGDFRNFFYLKIRREVLQQISKGITPEMAAAVSKLMRIQDLINVASKCSVITKFRNTIGLKGRFSTRLQPNHPTDDYRGIAASMIDGLFYGNGDAVIGINPATDSVPTVIQLVSMLDSVRQKFDIPIQTCILSHITTTIKAIERGAPIDLVFQSIGGTEATNTSFGVNLDILKKVTKQDYRSIEAPLAITLCILKQGKARLYLPMRIGDSTSKLAKQELMQ